VLVDVGVDDHDRQAAPGQVPDEQRRQRRAAASALAGERDLHWSVTLRFLSGTPAPPEDTGMVFIFM